jgi:molybdate transport system substrate-binding protein
MAPQVRAAGPSALKILTSHSSFSLFDALAPSFERAGGQQYAVEADSAKTMLARIKGGETADIVVLGTAEVNELAAQGVVVAGSQRPVAHARVGVAVRAGVPRPDISTVDAFKRTLLGAKSIAHTVHGKSGMYVHELLQRLGIAESMKGRVVTRQGGYIARVVASGEAEIAIQQIVELLAVPGVALVGPLPDEIQQVFETSAGIFAASKKQDAAAALIEFIRQPARAGVFREKGLEQARV